MKTSNWILIVSLLSVAGCGAGGDDASQTPTAAVQMSVSVAPPATSFAPDACGNELASAQLLFRRLRLDGETPCTATPDDDCDVEAEVGPFLVDLAGADFNGTIQQGVLTAQIPVATYDRARFKLHKLEDDASANGDPVLQAMIDEGLSIVIAGTTAGGAPFTFESDVNDEQEKTIALDVGNSVTGIEGITLTVDPSTWLGEAGSCLDPVADHDVIEGRIRTSIDFEEDDEQDG